MKPKRIGFKVRRELKAVRAWSRKSLKKRKAISAKEKRNE